MKSKVETVRQNVTILLIFMIVDEEISEYHGIE